MAYQLRNYQREAVNAAWDYLRNQAGNPVICLPTGSGKSLVIAQLCADALAWNGRILVVQHRKELISQNAGKIESLLPDSYVGVYSAGLRSRDTMQNIVCCGIQSVYKKGLDFDKRHLMIIDECHLCPHDGEGQYKSFIDAVRTANPNLRIIGLTATPFRLDAGAICRPDGIFQKICYNAPIRALIEQGYLANLTTNPSQTHVNIEGLHVRGGEFIASEMESAFDRETEKACQEIYAGTRDRKSVLIFCSGVEHAKHVASTMSRISGERCDCVTGDSTDLERGSALAAFRNRELRFLTNCDVLTVGFDAPCIDAIAILRATMSAGLYAQICGRGFRVFPDKKDCLVMDFGQNIARHGPLDAIDFGKPKVKNGNGTAPTKICPNCASLCFAGVKVCPDCGFQFPAEKKSVESESDTETPILSEPEYWEVQEVTYSLHRKKKEFGPPTLRVDYACLPEGSSGGNLEPKIISEWVCLQHIGFARRRAEKWWKERSVTEVPETIEEAVDYGLRGALAWPKRLTTLREGKWYRVSQTDLEEKPREWLDSILTNDFDELPF